MNEKETREIVRLLQEEHAPLTGERLDVPHAFLPKRSGIRQKGAERGRMGQVQNEIWMTDKQGKMGEMRYIWQNGVATK